MQDPSAMISVILIVGGVFAFVWWIDRAVKRSEFREECRRHGRERLRKPTGWEPLDDINAKLWDAYQRRYSCD